MRRSFLALVLLGALGGCSSAAGSQQSATVVIHHSAFRPEHMSFAAGTTVTFTVKNTDPIDHEFLLGDKELQLVHEYGTEKHHGARPGEISIPAGEERSTTYTFTDGGTLIYGCHLPGHYAYGMRGTVSVK
jgi:uncharacterized cupredoxin-like copper-binding protein